MYEHAPGKVLKDTNASFGNAVGVVCVYTCKSEALLLRFAVRYPIVRTKDAVVGVVCSYVNASFSGVLFECAFTSQCFLCGARFLEPNEAQA